MGKGPDWLKESEDNWNKRVSFDEHPIPSEERDIQKILLPVIVSDLPLLEKISSYSDLVGVIAWILRFANNTRKGNERNNNLFLSLPELEKAEELWWRIAQEATFKREIQDLKDERKLSPGSRILLFRPFLDKRWLLRVGGRLQKGKIPLLEHHPISCLEVTELQTSGHSRARPFLACRTHASVRLVVPLIQYIRRKAGDSCHY